MATFLGILLVFIIVVFINGLMSPNQSVKTNENKYNKSHYFWEPTGEYDFEVVGESYYQNALKKIVGGGQAEDYEVTAYLVPEDNNQYDKKAVRIDVNEMTVGHLSREDARKFRKTLQKRNLDGQVTKCAAIVRGGGESFDGEDIYYGIFLDLEPF